MLGPLRCRLTRWRCGYAPPAPLERAAYTPSPAARGGRLPPRTAGTSRPAGDPGDGTRWESRSRGWCDLQHGLAFVRLDQPVIDGQVHSNHSRNCVRADWIGFAADIPSPHSDVVCRSRPQPARRSRSWAVPVPATKRSKIGAWRVPIRHGVHLPQDSISKKCSNSRRIVTGETDWSQSKKPPEPKLTPCAADS